MGGPDSDARSLLAGWTVLWHPLLLAQTEQMPTWYRADSPPTPDGPRVIVVPEPSLGQIPSDFRRKCEANPDCLWVTGADREEMLRAFKFAGDDAAAKPLEFSGRALGVEDFYAAGFLTLQIQIMTRRLRYTSNLDELHLQNRITAAAKAFRDRDAESAAEALHDVFDSLSEERDHYFSSDPALIDLTLLTPGTLDAAIDDGWIERLEQSARADDEGNGILGTPRNVLIDGDVAQQLCQATESGNDGRYQSFRKLLSGQTIGWAGGGASDSGPEHCLDALTMAKARHRFESGTTLAEKALGSSPQVFGQFAGMTPADLVPALAALDYRGVIPIDFSSGSGFGDESKVIVSGGGSDLEALTAKPIDAASDAAFLSIGAHLGEAIDTGEVATALLVHWPDRVCDSFLDLCRAATWSVAMGRFWTLNSYFTDGERPYHHGNLQSVSGDSANEIAEAVADPNSDHTLHSIASRFRETVRQESNRTTESIATLAKPGLADEQQPGESSDERHADDEHARISICKAIGIDPQQARPCHRAGHRAGERADERVDEPAGAVSTRDLMCFNPHGTATRQQGLLSGGAPSKHDYVYASSDGGNDRCDVTFDVPAMGFTRLSATAPVTKTGLLKRLTGRKSGIAESAILRNEFMAVSLDESTGGIAGVYSASRGNRLSMKLVAAQGLGGDKDGGQMVCHRIKTSQSDAVTGVIDVEGDLLAGNGNRLARFTLRYQVNRGSRLLHIEGTLSPTCEIKISSPAEVWKKYFALRTAVAGEAAIVRALVRDKVHSTTSKRIVAPLGTLIDEAEKQTLVVSHGLPLHRKAGDRFLDTLVALPAVAGRNDQTANADVAIPFAATIAFDAPGPVAVARSCIAPPDVLAINDSNGTSQAWLVHVSAGDVLITEISTRRRSDGKLAARMQVVRTRPKSSRVRIQFCVHAHAAFIADSKGIDRELEELPQDVTCDDGVVELTLRHHEAVELIVVFDV